MRRESAAPGVIVIFPAAFAASIRSGLGGRYWWTRATADFISSVSSAVFFSIILPFRPRCFSGGGGSDTGVFCTWPSGP